MNISIEAAMLSYQLTRIAQGVGAVDYLRQAMNVDIQAAVRSLATYFLMRPLTLDQLNESTPAFNVIPIGLCQQRVCMLIESVDSSADAFYAVVSDPFDLSVVHFIEQAAGTYVDVCLAAPDDLKAFLSQQERQHNALDSMNEVAPDDVALVEGAELLSFGALLDASSQVVKLVNSVLLDALKLGASDIHLECTSAGLAIKYRIDGLLDLVKVARGVQQAEQVMSRLKVLAELDIAERRIPQDGSFRVTSDGRDIDLRLSIMPSIHGEDAVIRVLDKRPIFGDSGLLSLEQLGFDRMSLETLRRLAAAPYGMILVTGPTGSGKTTTLYGLLSECYTGKEKVITIEDPVEYQLPDILQIPVNDKKGLTFARGLRSILRHDPDKIMIGEIRDTETAEIAVQSALTGHLVMTTVHANNVFDVFGRFTHMGIDFHALVSALNGIWAQRLVRTICGGCVRPARVDDVQMGQWCKLGAGRQHGKLLEGVGCPMCRGSGYKGRRAIAEILPLDDELRELIVSRAPSQKIKDAARLKGTKRLLDAALDLAFDGHTTLEEVQRVTMAS